MVNPAPCSEKPLPGTADWLMPTEHQGTAAGDLTDAREGKDIKESTGEKWQEISQDRFQRHSLKDRIYR